MSRQSLKGPCAWYGDQLVEAQWQRSLNTTDIADIDRALAGTVSLGWPQITRDNFPLPNLGPKLVDTAQELEEGCGMVRLRGLPVKQYEESVLRKLWMGLCAHLGTPVFQNSQGQLMRNIRDEGSGVGARYGQMQQSGDETFLSSRARTASTAPLRFHTDRTDVVGLLCEGQAKAGGLSKLASAVTVHNEMLRLRPDLLELLYDGIPRSRLGEEEGGDAMVYHLPVFGVRDGKFTSHYSRTYVEAAQLLPGTSKLSQAHWEALDLLAELAEEHCLEMRLEPGDMQFLNNHVIYHARTAFENDVAGGFDRNLFRVWLCVPNNRALPEDHAVLWGSVEAGQMRGGIGQTVGQGCHLDRAEGFSLAGIDEADSSARGA